MLVQRLKLVRDILNCSNVELAEMADCSPSHISKIFSGKRKMQEKGTAALQFADVLLQYARQNQVLPSLCLLCECEESTLNAAYLSAWLYGEGCVGQSSVAEENNAKIERSHFGERFNLLMTELDLSNVRLSKLLNVDASLISRFRTGKRSPHKNEQFVHYLCEVLLENMRQSAMTDKVARLLQCDVQELCSDQAVLVLQKWLFDKAQIHKSKNRTGEYLNLFWPMQKEDMDDLQGSLMQLGEVEKADTYWGIDGARNAILRLLTEAASEGGGEVYMYTDQSMQWLLEDSEVLSLWYKCSAMCMRSNVHLTIIHDFNRKIDEVTKAMQMWIPLYMTGKVTPYYCTLNRGSRFSHMLFLRPGTAAITSWHGQGVTVNNFYNYIQDPRILNALHTEIKALVKNSEPLVQTFTLDDAQQYYSILAKEMAKSAGSLALLPSPSSVTLPKEVFVKMLANSNLSDSEKENIQQIRQCVHEKLQNNTIIEMVELPSLQDVQDCNLRLCMGISALREDSQYTKEDFRVHIREIIRLCETQPNFQFCVLSKVPFPGTRIIITDHCTIMIRLQDPCTAFVVNSAFFTKAFAVLLYDYYEQSRLPVERTIEMLKKYLDD